jgi:hypothetical protein
MKAWLAAFLFTQIIEVPIYTRALRGRALVAFGASALTHPIVWFVLPRLLFASSYRIKVLLYEIFAIGAEAIYMGSFGLRRPLFWSFIANAISASLALICRANFGWP